VLILDKALRRASRADSCLTRQYDLRMSAYTRDPIVQPLRDCQSQDAAVHATMDR
jgi:hypothetical protein